MEDLRVIIIGAGIGGLGAAIALTQAGFQVSVYEKTREFRPVGAGISLWSNGVKVLNRLGLAAQIAAIGGQMDHMQYLSHTGDRWNSIPLQPLIDATGQRPYPVARRDLQQILLNAYPGTVQFDHRCVDISQDAEGVTATFENGAIARGDLLIAADGIHSMARSWLLEKPVEPRYAGYVNWNGLVEANESLAPLDTWVIYVGNHQRASMMPVGGNRFYFFFDVPLLVGTTPHPSGVCSELKTYFQDWAEPVQNLIAQIDPDQTNRLEIHDVGPLDCLVCDRVALLGDSGHATCPDLGQGGAQALEDAWVLTHYLKTTTLSVTDALQRYQAERKERTDRVIEKARRRAELIHGHDATLTQQWYHQLQTESPIDVTDAIAKIILAGPMR